MCSIAVNIQMCRTSLLTESALLRTVWTISFEKCSRDDRHDCKYCSHGTEKLAKENGIEKASLGSSIMINFNVRKQTLSFSATVKGERKDVYSTGDVQTGKVTNFRVK